MGSGKSTLAEMLAQHMGGEAHFESVVDNPYLDDFYKDMPAWSFQLQVYFLTHRYQAHSKIQSKPGINIQDRTIYEDANIFAPVLYKSGHLSDRDYKNYLFLYNSIVDTLRKPDIIVYLRTPIAQIQDRIKLRNRDCEKEVSVDYLAALNHQYDEWISKYDGPVLDINNEGLDFKNRKTDFDYIVNQLKSFL